MEINSVIVSGVIESELIFNNSQFGENFYKMIISVERNSGVKDYIPVLISERLINVRENYCDKHIKITGQFRSYDSRDGEKSKLLLFVFVKECGFLDDANANNTNSVELTGFICKKPVRRKTPLGREVTDVLLAVNRQYYRTDYIPCICWGRNAKYVEGLNVGDQIKIAGRIQSREYKKRTSEGETESRTAYEVSIMQLEYLDDAGEKK